MNDSSVAGHLWIDPVIIDVTVKDLQPRTGPGKSHIIRWKGRVVERGDDYDIVTGTFHPSMIGHHTIRIVHVKDVDGR